MNMRHILFVFSVLAFYACANIGSPKGGPKDENPPVLQLDESTKNFQTNFKKQDITLVFNEFIELKDMFNQVVISPPLKEKWNLTKKLKTVEFSFDKDEVLRENATYTINFGEAIVDYTEGNPAEDMRFVFSTGDYIDSMEVSGQIVDALTRKPAEEVLVLLYDNLADSVIYTERPFYFAKTKKDGSYKIQNVKTDTFKVIALKDEDLNYLFNQDSEFIGFTDSLFYLSNVKETLPTIAVFQERPELQLVPPSNKSYGKVLLQFNQDPYDVKLTSEDIGQQVYYETEGDSIKVWYDQTDTIAWNVFVEQGDEFKDTFLVEPSDRSAFVERDSLKRINQRVATDIKLNPTKPVRLSFNHPLIIADSALVLLLEDSIRTPVVSSIELEGRELLLDFRWKENMLYQLEILPGSLTDIFGMKNQDTIRQNYIVQERKLFGDIRLKVIELEPSSDYIIKLFFENNTNLVESFSVSGQDKFEHFFKTLPEGQYLVEIITDWNGNGRWDTGNYDLKLQPEPFVTQKLDKLRANWELDSEVTLGQ